MGSLKSIALAGVFAIGASASSLAADLLPPPPVAYPPPPVEVGGGWYLRGDVGVGIVDFEKFEGVNTGIAAPVGGYFTEQDSIEDQVFVGVGAGYQFNQWLRFDLTGEYRTSTAFKIIERDMNVVPTGYNKVDGKLGSVVGLANVYFDLGTWHGITPFVGGGVGFVHHRMHGIADYGFGGAAGGIGWAPDKSTTNLAWAVHAGLGYDVTPNLKLEAGYRYLNMGDAESGVVTCNAVCTAPVYKLKEIDSHDIKIGMRWLLASPVAYAPPPPPPLIRKY
jgi:opacity protein-like surface antigen